MYPREASPTTLTNTSSMVEEVTQEEEDLTKGAEVEEEAERLSIGATNATNWGIYHSSV